MEKDKKTILWRYLLCFGIGLVFVVVVCAIGGFFQDNAKENMKLLHNAFFSVGGLMVLFSGLLYVSSEGAFLGIGYAFSWVIKSLIPLGRRKMQETYAEYRERKLSKEKKKGDHCLVFTGLLFIAVSIVFLVIWYRLPS